MKLFLNFLSLCIRSELVKEGHRAASHSLAVLPRVVDGMEGAAI